MTNERSGNLADVTLREFVAGQKVFGRYTLVKIVGRGGMGVVWLARDEELVREVALKFLPDLVVQDQASLDDIKSETRRNLALTHRNIVRIYDFLHDETSGCISMEYLDGDTLSNLRAAREQGVCEMEEIARWTGQLCDALDYAHNHARIIHGDLRPANLMVNQKSQLKVSDFAIARSLGDSISRLTMTRRNTGTLAYMSPQQLDGHRVTPLDDVYSVGATLYDLLTGKPPFYSGDIDRQIREEVAPSITQRRKEFDIEPPLVPAVWEEVVGACLAKDPIRRPQSTAEIAQRLQLSPSRAGPITIETKKARKTSLIAATVAVVTAIAVAGLYLLVWKQQSKPTGELRETQVGKLTEKSVAVLPFENLSGNADDVYIANGIQDEIITRVGKIAAVKAIARTSSRQYESKPGNLAEIGKQLSAASIVFGSIQRERDQLRLKVRLVNSSTGSELWAQSYEGKFADVLTFESEVATQIAKALQATVSPAEKERVTAAPTKNSEAYVLYLRARALLDTRAAARILYYEQAIAVDPTFALAHAALSVVHSYAYKDPQDDGAIDPDPARTAQTKAKARQAAEEALRIQPDLGEGHLALGLYYQRVERNFEAARKEYEIAELSLPNDADLIRQSGLMRRRTGHWKEAVGKLERAAALDPRNLGILSDLAETYSDLHEWEAAEQTRQRAVNVALAGSAFDVYRTKIALGWVQQARTGNFAQLHAALDEVPAIDRPYFTVERWNVNMAEHDFDAAARLLASETKPEFNLAPRWSFRTPRNLLLGWTALAKGELDRAKPLVEAALPAAEAEMNLKPSRPKPHAFLGGIYAYLGRKDEAVKEGQRAMELLPEKKDSFEGPKLSAYMAEIYAHVGESDLAMGLIERLLVTPASGINAADLRSSWRWDPLRDHPRFQKILASPEPKIVY